MNTKIIAGLLALVLIVQMVQLGTGTGMSENISSITAQQTSILYKVDQIAGVGGSGILNYGEPGPGGISWITNYLFNRCSVTTYNEVTGSYSTQSGGYQTSTPNGPGCDFSGPQSATAGTGTTNNIVPLKNGMVSVSTSPDMVSIIISPIKSR